MLGYPITDSALRRLTQQKLKANPLPHKVARKAQARGVVSRDITNLTGTTLGTISHRNSPDGLVVDYTATEQGFPDGTDSMNFYADLTGISEALLIANIRGGGGPGTILAVSGAGELISVGLDIITAPPEIVVGLWHPVTASGATLLSWSIRGDGAGTVTVGLCQLIGR